MTPGQAFILMVMFSLLIWAYAIIGFKEVHFKEEHHETCPGVCSCSLDDM